MDKIKTDLDNLILNMQIEYQKMEEQKKLHEENIKEFDLLQKKIDTLSSKSKNKIKLNIGGTIFTTSLETLTLEKTFFSSMFSEQFFQPPDDDDAYFIDRNPKYFHIILDYLRYPTRELNLNELTSNQIDDFLFEVQFYCVKSLEDKIESLTKTEKDIKSNKIQVFGAGAPNMNGIYVESGTYHDKPQYIHSEDPEVFIWFRRDSNEWRMGKTNDYYYIVPSQSDKPPCQGWELGLDYTKSRYLNYGNRVRNGTKYPAPILKFI